MTSAVTPDVDGLTGLGRRSALAFVGAAVSGVATIATLVVATRALTGTGAGEFFVAISLFGIVQGVCSFGIETGLQYFIPTMDSPKARRLIAITSWVSGLAGLAVAALVWLLAGPFGTLLSEGDGDVSTRSVVRTIAVCLPFAGLYEVVMGALRACDRVLVSTVLDRILRPVAQVVAMVAVAAMSGGQQAVVLAWALPNVVAVIVAVMLLRNVGAASRATERIDVSLRQFWSYTAPRSIARVAQTLTQRLDVLILAAVYPLDEAAVYGTVSRCMIAGVFIATALRQTVQPQLRRLIVRGDKAAVKQMYGASTTWLVLVTWPVYLTMMFNADHVMRVFGPTYERGAPALTLLCSAMLVASACGLVDVVLLMLGRSWLSTINVVVALTLNVALNVVLAPRFGMIGSSIAWVVAILATNLLPLRQTMSEGIHPGGRPLGTAIGLAVATIAAPTALSQLVFGSGIAASIVMSIVTAGLFVGGTYALRTNVMLDRLVSDLRRRPRLAAGR